MREVEDALIVGVGVDRRHHAALNAECVVKNLGHGCQAVGRAGGIGQDVLGRRVVGRLIDAHDDRDVLVLGRGGDDHLARASLQVRPRLGGVSEVPRGLDDDGDAHGSPGQRGRVLLGEDANSATTHDELAVAVLHREREPTEDAVVLQQVRQRGRVGQVVDADHIDVLHSGGDQRPVEVAADASEAVDADGDGHGFSCV